jgi:hypothetical protein
MHFDLENFDDETLWRLVNDKGYADKTGFVKDGALLRELAEKDTSNNGMLIIQMELIGLKAAWELLKRQNQSKFGDINYFVSLDKKFDW